MVLDQLRSVSQGNRLQELCCLRNKTQTGNTGCLSPPRWQPPPRVAVSPAGTRGRKPGTPAIIEQSAAQPAASPEGAPSGRESTRYWPRELRSSSEEGQRKGVGELRPCIFPCRKAQNSLPWGIWCSVTSSNLLFRLPVCCCKLLASLAPLSPQSSVLGVTWDAASWALSPHLAPNKLNSQIWGCTYIYF